MNFRIRAAYLAGLLDGINSNNALTDEVNMVMHKIISAIADLSTAVDAVVIRQRTTMIEMNELVKFIELMTGNFAAAQQQEAQNRGEGEADDDDVEIKIVCPYCGREVWLDNSVLDEEDVICNFCGEEIEIDFDDKFNN